ncbi:unnamed protein product [Effrenium voratum]|nr:unnamed protein product [Effrenium voratum]
MCLAEGLFEKTPAESREVGSPLLRGKRSAQSFQASEAGSRAVGQFAFAMATQALRCVVRYHRGIEQQESVPEDEDPYDTLLLRIIIGLPGAPESSADELQLHGRWAALLQTTGPEDLLLVEGAEELTDAEHSGRCFSVLGETPAVTIYREGIHHRVDKETFQSLHLPEWLRPPPTSKARSRLARRELGNLRRERSEGVQVEAEHSSKFSRLR